VLNVDRDTVQSLHLAVRLARLCWHRGPRCLL